MSVLSAYLECANTMGVVGRYLQGKRPGEEITLADVVAEIERRHALNRAVDAARDALDEALDMVLNDPDSTKPRAILDSVTGAPTGQHEPPSVTIVLHAAFAYRDARLELKA